MAHKNKPVTTQTAKCASQWQCKHVGGHLHWEIFRISQDELDSFVSETCLDYTMKLEGLQFQSDSVKVTSNFPNSDLGIEGPSENQATTISAESCRLATSSLRFAGTYNVRVVASHFRRGFPLKFRCRSLASAENFKSISGSSAKSRDILIPRKKKRSRPQTSEACLWNNNPCAPSCFVVKLSLNAILQTLSKVFKISGRAKEIRV